MTCRGRHRQEAVFRVVVRLRDLWILLTKKTVWVSGQINSGDVTRESVDELMADTGYFSKVCVCSVFSGLVAPLQ